MTISRWALLTDGVWCLDDDSVILHVERDKFCSGPGAEDLASIAPDFAVEEKFEKYFGYLARCEGKFCI